MKGGTYTKTLAKISGERYTYTRYRKKWFTQTYRELYVVELPAKNRGVWTASFTLVDQWMHPGSPEGSPEGFRQTNYYKLTFKMQRTANEYAAKSKIYKRPDQQIYTLSRHSEFCKADRATAVDSCFALCGRKGRNRCLWLRPRSVFGPFGVVLMSCKVNFHVVRSA